MQRKQRDNGLLRKHERYPKGHMKSSIESSMKNTPTMRVNEEFADAHTEWKWHLCTGKGPALHRFRKNEPYIQKPQIPSCQSMRHMLSYRT